MSIKRIKEVITILALVVLAYTTMFGIIYLGNNLNSLESGETLEMCVRISKK